jgi:hypothetical protein
MNELETAVLEMIGEDTTSPDVFSDDAAGMAQIRNSLNDAIQEIAMLTAGVRRRIRIPLVSGAIFYQLTLSQDIFAWPLSCWLINQKRRIPQKDIIWLNKANSRWMLGSGSPLFYYLIGFDKIGLDRAPSSDTDILEFDCIVIPGPYDDESTRIKLRDEYKWAAVHYAVSEFWASRGDANEANMHFMEYVNHIGIQELYPLTNERTWMYRSEKKAAAT